MTPSCRIMINGALVSGVFMSRVISCVVTDKQGASSDTVDILLNDFPWAVVPPTGAIIRVWMGYGAAGMAFMGSFTVEEVEVQLLPYKLSIRGKAADHRGKGKENKERGWEEKTLGAIVSEIASERGLQPIVDGKIGGHLYKWLGQQDESDPHFLERMARKHDALYSEKDGKLIFASRGSGLSVSGAALTPVIITPANLVPNTARVRFSDRSKYKSVKASYTDPKTRKKTDVEEDSAPDGEAVYRIGEPFADEDEAKRAAQAKSKELLRATMAFSCTIVGNPVARAGAPVSFLGCRPGIDGIPFITETAGHRYSKQGYQTTLSGETQA